MTDEQLKKANEINEKIKKYDRILNSITCNLKNKKRINEDCKKRYWDWQSKRTLKKFFTLRVKHDDNKKAYLIPHYELSSGTEIDVEEDFVLMVKEYFEKKKEQAEKEFKELE